jgi:hypothetical protein
MIIIGEKKKKKNKKKKKKRPKKKRKKEEEEEGRRRIIVRFCHYVAKDLKEGWSLGPRGKLPLKNESGPFCQCMSARLGFSFIPSSKRRGWGVIMENCEREVLSEQNLLSKRRRQ